MKIAKLMVLFLADHADCHKCYNCGNQDNLFGCDNFDPFLNEFIRECPPEYQGCSTILKNGLYCGLNGFPKT